MAFCLKSWQRCFEDDFLAFYLLLNGPSLHVLNYVDEWI